MCCNAGFDSAWPLLTNCLSKHCLKWLFLYIYLTTFSESVTSKIQNARGSSFFPNSLKSNLDFFCFWDNCMWIGIVKLSPLTTGYFSLVANALTSCPKIWHVNKRSFFARNFVASDEWIWSMGCGADFNCARASLPCFLSQGLLKQDFLDIYLTTFSDSVISEIRKLWGWSFFSEIPKFNLNFQIAAKNWEKVSFLR